MNLWLKWSPSIRQDKDILHSETAGGGSDGKPLDELYQGYLGT